MTRRPNAATLAQGEPVPVPEQAEPVFVLTLPLDLAPTLNSYANWETWRRQRVKGEINTFIMLALKAAGYEVRMPVGKDVSAAGRKRRAVVTRHSSREVDEVAVDIIGGKAVVDCLVRAGILAGDSAKELQREARWVKAKPGAGKLTVEIYNV